MVPGNYKPLVKDHAYMGKTFRRCYNISVSKNLFEGYKMPLKAVLR